MEQPEKLFRFFVDYFSVAVLSAALLSAHLQGLLKSLKLERKERSSSFSQTLVEEGRLSASSV